MGIIEISKMATTFDPPHIPGDVHESIFRSYHILDAVKRFLIHGVPNNIILELIEEMEGGEK